MERITPESSVRCISGVGETRAKQLEKIGICTLRDLIYKFPRFYEERGNIRLLSEGELDIPSAYLLTVASEVKSVMIRRGLTISKFRAFDDSGTIEVVFFNSAFVKDIFHTGTVFRFWGRVSLSKNQLQLQNPKYEPYVEGVPLPHFVPIYSLTEGITSKFIDKITASVLDTVVNQIPDPIPDRVRVNNSLPALSYALRNLHFPESAAALKKSLRRLAFDEMLCFGIGISKLARSKNEYDGIRFSPCDLAPFLKLLPYELTESQKRTVNDIYRDTVIGKADGKISPMTRIVVGDVGSGKTVCASLAIYIAAKSGYQSAFMAPTEILATQHYLELKEQFSALGIGVELLLGSTAQKEKKRIYAAIEGGKALVVIGTHALISDKVSFSNLGLIITDEQHRFGVNQRGVLKEKTKSAHMLVMSATPIPRTLALTMYGDLDVSRITELPKGRQRVDTFVVDETYRTRLNSFIEKQISLGGQCYVVCPAIEAPEDAEFAVEADSISEYSAVSEKRVNLKNATEHCKKLRQSLKSITIDCLHGKMKATEKDEVMKRFSNGDTKVLVSTTVVEVGVNVPNASLMIVENAERFGLSQLHQLRGRVGRGKRKSYCVLVFGNKSDKAAERLEIMRTTYDGYEIAERDLLMRGPGDFFAGLSGSDTLRQSGGFEFKIASLCDDTELLDKAFSAAKQIISEDPLLEKQENIALRNETERLIAPSGTTIS